MAAKIGGLVSKFMANAGPKFGTFMYYAKTELTPPSPTDIVAIKNSAQNIVLGFKNGSWKKLTVKEAWLNSLITLEVACWFYIGEVIGKRQLRGYDV